MKRRLFAILLSVMLVFGGIMGASAAELSLSQDLVDETSLRFTTKAVYGELEWKTDNAVLHGMNIGLKARSSGPFYGLAQANFDAGSETGFGAYESFEVGFGAEYSSVWNLNVGAEFTAENINIDDLSTIEPNVSIFAGIDFCVFPGSQTCGVDLGADNSNCCPSTAPQEDTQMNQNSQQQDEKCYPCDHDEYWDPEDNTE